MSSSSKDFCYALCALNNLGFEVHVDVEYLGNSGAVHEIDISIYDHGRADAIRLNPGALPAARSLHGAIECKFYDSQLGTALGRTFVGLVDDCGQLRIKGFATNGQSNSLALYFSKSSRPTPTFSLSPLNPQRAQSFVAQIEQKLRQWAGVPS